MAAIQLPCTLFQTRKWINDYGAADMRCGDLTEVQLKKHFHLVDVSARVNPYTLTKITAFNQPQSRFYGMRGQGEKVTRQECAKILFDEFRHLSRPFAIYGPYRYLIGKMIDHMQYGNGTLFRDFQLNHALKDQILSDRTGDNSSLLRIKMALAEHIDWENGYFDSNKKGKLAEAISESVLPKFNRVKDSFNGMGITIHDTHATHVTMKSLTVDGNNFIALINYKVQDHFGLDNEDILKWQFHYLQFFRVWFLLQRFNRLGFRPFISEMDVTIELKGSRDS